MKLMKYQIFLESNSNKHTYYIPSYEECREMCDANGNLIFYETKHSVGGYNVSIFNYRLASYNNFVTPIETKPEVKAFEMRGLSFVFNKDGSLFKRYLLLDKFFNMDQTPCSLYSIVKDFKIKNVYVKEDGSVASFIMLPNGRVVAKSKASFDSDQAKEIQKIYDSNKKLQKFVTWCLNNEINPVFEYVSPRNRIVIPYKYTDLVLLRVRDNNTGEYLDINEYLDHLNGITLAVPENDKSLDGLIELKSIVKDIEGWVVQFENGKMVKVKGDHYCSLHGLLTDSLNRENDIIELILDEKIDDVLAQIPEDDLRRQDIDAISKIISNEMIFMSNKTDELLLKYKGDKKAFAIANIKDPFFNFAIGVVNGKDKSEMIKLEIKKHTKHLMDARKWLDERGYKKVDIPRI